MTNLYIVFEHKEIKYISDIKNQLIISYIDLPIELANNNIIVPLNYTTDDDIIKNFRNYFDNKFRNLLEFGYINNFYECTIRPIYTLFNTISQLNNLYKFKVIFITKYLYYKKGSTYFLAEFESQGTFFYNRSVIFTPYLLEFFKKNNIKYSFLRSSYALNYFFYPFLRIFLVYFYRFFISFKHNSFLFYENVKKSNSLLLVRSDSQSDFMTSIINQLTNSSVLIINSNLLKKNIKLQNYKKHKVKLSTILLLKQQFIVFKKIVRCFLDEQNFEICEISFSIKQALLEMIVMSGNLYIYNNQLSEFINLYNNKYKYVFSLEQKSPHAYIDSLFAKKMNSYCVHFLICDQFPLNLPKPVFGDLYLLDSETRLKLFYNKFDIDKNKLKYFRNFKEIKWLNYTNDFKISNFEFCMFLNLDYDLNIQLIDFFINSNFSFIVKLHPRDNIKLYKKYKSIKFFINVDEFEFFNYFAIAVSFTSGIITDLIFAHKPFILLLLPQDYNLLQPYYNKNYIGNVDFNNLEQIFTIEKNILINNFKITYNSRINYNNESLLEFIDKEIN